LLDLKEIADEKTARVSSIDDVHLTRENMASFVH